MNPLRPTFLICLLAAFVAGCTDSPTAVRVKSVEASTADEPRVPLAVYRSTDLNTAEVYLTDLDPATLEPGADLTHITGRIVQIRMFMQPLAGSTPIASTACSVVVRHIVLADGAVGVYSGGGFIFLGSSPGKPTFSGRIQNATLRLTAHNAAFTDPLGPSTLDATFTARNDDAAASTLSARVDEILLRLPATSIQTAHQ
jgi:hypothetical protein